MASSVAQLWRFSVSELAKFYEGYLAEAGLQVRDFLDIRTNNALLTFLFELMKMVLWGLWCLRQAKLRCVCEPEWWIRAQDEMWLLFCWKRSWHVLLSYSNLSSRCHRYMEKGNSSWLLEPRLMNWITLSPMRGEKAWMLFA